MTLRFGNFVYFYVILAGLGLGYRPLHVLWGGIVGALALEHRRRLDRVAAGHGADAAAGNASLGDAAWRRCCRRPSSISTVPLQDVVVFLIVASLLALIVARSRALVWRQAALERERGNLARYFPPATVDRLARQDVALEQPREQDVAVLFADLVGFTHWSERHGPREVIALLRDVHARLEEAVFRHDGTLDKFIGDGMMATFGTPDPGAARRQQRARLPDRDPGRVRGLERAPRARRARSRSASRSGCTTGRSCVGNIGTDRRLEFAVLGDTVNVASRLEALTRELDCRAAISGALANAVMIEAAGEGTHSLASFAERGPQALRGREEKVSVLTYG